MSAGHDHAHSFDGMNGDFKRRLMLVPGINVAMFFVEMSAGAVSGSQALKADALDFFADGLTYALSFWAIGKAANVRTGAAVVKGASLLLMGATRVGFVWSPMGPGATAVVAGGGGGAAVLGGTGGGA